MTQSLESSADEVRLVLCMIVKNEAAVLRRCLESALPHVDAFVVCDTGSSDNTIEVIEELASQFEVDGRVERHEWRNFGHNRTLSANEARRWAVEAGWSAEKTYLLFLDADMVLRVDPAFDKRQLKAASYDVMQEDGTLRYWNTRLACLSHEWVAVGATHEYWQAAPSGAPSARLESLRIQDMGDGGSRAHKFERDVLLLRQELARDPGNPRHTFYLAQSYFDTRHWSEAAEWYQRRLKLGGWEEERWYARYRLGLCLLQMGDGQRGAGVLLEAFDERPTRAEPLWAVARHYREHSRNTIAFMFARRGLDLAYPSEDVLFLEEQVYEWQLWEEVMISAYYAGPDHHDLGLGACERLAARRGHDPSFYNYVATNESFYLPTLEASRRGAFTVPREVRDREGVEFHAANPTIARWRGSTYVNVRLLNYSHEAGLNYSSMSPDGVFRTYNATLAWDPETGRGGSIQITDDIPGHWSADTWGRGLEDVRWAVFEDRLWFTAVCYQVPGAEGACRVVLGRLNTELDAVEHLVPLSYAQARAVEKNWLLWPDEDGLRVIYSYDPFIVLRVDPASGDTTTIHTSEPPFRAADFRGSCTPVPLPDGSGRSIGLVHEVAFRPSGRVYSHRWIEIDDVAGLVSYSRPFVFDHVGIEYANGLCDLDGERLIVTYGFEDREARWIECRWDVVIAALRAGETQPRPRARTSRPRLARRPGSEAPSFGEVRLGVPGPVR